VEKLVDNTFEWSANLPMKTPKKYGTNLWESQSTFTMWCFQKNLKIFSKHSKNINLSNSRDVHIIDLETLHDKLLSL